MSKEAERIKAIVNRYNDNIGRLIDPVVERPITRVTVSITWDEVNINLVNNNVNKKGLPPP